MKLKRRRVLEVPPKIKAFISSVTAVPLENLEEPLKGFIWEFDKGDFHHWVDLFNHFDSFFEKYIKPRRDLQLEDNFLGADPPFPREAVLQILRVIRTILENCTNKHFYSSFEHLSSLLASTDADVVEASLQTLAAFLKKTIGKCSIRDASLNSKLFAFSQGWGGKEEGLGLIACSVEDGCDSVAYDLGCTLHFEFYGVNDSLVQPSEKENRGLQVIHLQGISTRQENDLELLNKLATEYNVPSSLRFSLLSRLRFARAFGSLASRQQYICIRLYAFVVLVQASNDADDLAAFFNNEPEFVSELVSLLSFEDAVPEKIRILAILSLVALCQDRSRQTSVLTAVTSGGYRGILPSLMQKSIDSITSDSSKWSVVFAESLLSLVTVLVSSSSGCSALREVGFIPTLLPLLKDTNPQHLHLVSTAVHVLEAFMDYSNPAAALFRDLGGLDDTIARLKVEVTYVEKGPKKQEEESQSTKKGKQIVGVSNELDVQPLYSEALITYHRRLLMKALLRAISLGTYAPGTSSRIYGSEESLLPHCLCIIFRRAKDFGGGVFSLAATVMSDLIHKDPTCFPVLDVADLPCAFLDAILGGVLCSSEAITCIPQCLDALCLNNSGLQAVKDRNALRCFVKIFTSRTYLRALMGDTPGSLSTGLDELMRHASSLRGPGVETLIEILQTISKIGSCIEAPPSSSDVLGSSSVPVPMETDTEEKNIVGVDDNDSSRMESSEQMIDNSDALAGNVESFLPEYVSNAARLLETVLQNADTCRVFIEKKGIEAVLQLFTLRLLPLSVSIGQSISIAFKNFSPQHSAALARSVCAFLREHLKLTNEYLTSVSGNRLAELELANQTKVLKCLSSVEGLLSLANFLLKGTTTMVSELGSADADVLKDLGKAYKEVLWQISLCSDAKVDEKQDMDAETGTSDPPTSNLAGRESDDDGNPAPYVTYLNPLAVRNGTASRWNAEHEFLSVVRSGDGVHRHGRHGLSRTRGGRIARHMEPSQIDSEGPTNASEVPLVQDVKKKSPDALVSEILSKVSFAVRSFHATLVKGFATPNRRRADSGALNSASKCLATALAKIFHEALSYSGQSASSAGLEMSLSVKCRYLGKVVEDMVALIFDNRRRSCNTALVNNFYVHGTFKELLTTFEATSQLLWTLPYSVPATGVDQGKSTEGNKLSHSLWLLDTLQSYCRLLEYFVNSALLLSPTSSSQTQLLVQPAAGLSIGLFSVPRDPEVFVRMLQSQVLDVILPVWNHPLFPNCSPNFIASVVSIVTHIYSGVGDVKRSRNGMTGGTSQRYIGPPPDESTIATIVEMGFTRARAEEALRRVESNSVEMAMEWLFSHAEDPVQEDDELARALALSLGNSTEASKEDSIDRTKDVLTEERGAEPPPIDDILAASMKLFQSSDSMAFPLTDLLVTLCNRKKGEDRSRVALYLIQQLKLCPSDFSKDTSALCTISHILALLLSEDSNMREIAAQNGIVSASIGILLNFRGRTVCREEASVPKCVSALLLILDNMLQSKPKVPSESTEGNSGSRVDSSGEDAALSLPVKESKSASDGGEKGSIDGFEKILGKSTGYLTLEESHQVLEVCCDLIKQHLPAMVMQAVLQLCSRLTKTHAIAMQFLENGGLTALFSLPRSCFFPGYDSVASAIIRHLLEDPQTLQTAMELEIRQTLAGIVSRHGSRLQPRTFLTSMAPVISRDPAVFMKAAAAVCQLDSSGGRINIVLSKEKDREKEKSKASVAEVGVISNECVRMAENKLHDGPVKCSRSHKKIPASLTQVIDQLLEIIMGFPSSRKQEESTSSLTPMDVDEPAMKEKGKSKVDEAKKAECGSLSERSTVLAKVTFVLKLMSDILLMYVHAVGVVLRRDSEISHLRGSTQVNGPAVTGGLLHHVLHQLLPLSSDKTAETADEWRDKLSEKASWFLVVLCGRSAEGRRRVVAEIVRAFSLFSESCSYINFLLPNKKVLGFADLVNSILSKNSSSSNLPSPGCSPDIAKTMIDGGMVECLTNVLQVIDLDHPDAPKVVNLILKALESLTRAANANEQVFKLDGVSKKKSSGTSGRNEDQANAFSSNEVTEQGQNTNIQQLSAEVVRTEQQVHISSHNEGDRDANRNMEQEMRTEMEESSHPPMEHAVEFMREEIDEGSVLRNTNGIEMTFRVEHRADDDMGDDDDEDMGEDGDEDDEDDEEDDDEDEDIAEEGAALMSLADTDVEDHDDNGLGDDYNDDLIDEEDDDFHENRVIEVRWREGLDGLDHLQVLGRPGAASGLIDVSAEPFHGVNVDDIIGYRRTLGVERRRPTGSRTFMERSGLEGTAFQHPLLLRQPQSADPNLSLWSSAGNSSRDLEALSVGSFDVAHFYMFDAPVLSSEHAAATLFGDRLVGAAPPPLIDFSLGMDPMHLGGRRGPGDGRWTDDGQPQAGGQAAAIAQAVEEQFISQLRIVTPLNSPSVPRQSENSARQEKPQLDSPPSHLSNQPQIADDIVGSQDGEAQTQGLGRNSIVHNQENQTDGGEPELPDSCEQIDADHVISEAGVSRQVDSDGVANGSIGSESVHIVDGPAAAGCRLETIPEVVTSSTGLDNVGTQAQDGMVEMAANLPDFGLRVCNDAPSATESHSSTHAVIDSGLEMPDAGDDGHTASICQSADVDMDGSDPTGSQAEGAGHVSVNGGDEPSARQNVVVAENANPLSNEASSTNTIDPTFLEALPEDLRAEVLASQQAQSVQPARYAPPTAEEIDPEFLAALPPDIQAEVLAQQRAQRVVQSQAEGQPVDMDNASIIATFPADLREEVLLTSSEAVLSALPSPLLAEAQMLRDRAMSHYQARSLFGGNHRLGGRRNGLGLDRQTVMDRGVGVTVGRRTVSAIANSLKVKEIEGTPLLDADALKALIRLLRLAQPLGKGLLQRLLLNLCAHSVTRATLIHLLLDMIKSEAEGFVCGSAATNSQRLYGCQWNVVYGRSQQLDGLPPLVSRRILEILTYLATNHIAVANILFYFDAPSPSECPNLAQSNDKEKGKEKMEEEMLESSQKGDIPLILFLKLLNRPLFLRSSAHLEQVMGLLQVVVNNAARKVECHSHVDVGHSANSDSNSRLDGGPDSQKDPPISECHANEELNKDAAAEGSSGGKKTVNPYDILLKLPESEMRNLCSLLAHEGLSDKVYILAAEVLKKLASVAAPHRKFFTAELAGLAHGLSSSAMKELVTLRHTQMLGLSAGSMAGAAILRVLQALSVLTSQIGEGGMSQEEQEEQSVMWKLNVAVEPLWQELSDCISATETKLGHSSALSSPISSANAGDLLGGGASLSPPLPPGTQRLIPFIEAFFVLCEKLQAAQSITQQDLVNVTAREVKESVGSSSLSPPSGKYGGPSERRIDGSMTFSKFADKHRRLLNAFIRQNPGLLEKSHSLMLKTPRLIDFDNKRSYFRSRIRQQHEQHPSAPLRISVRRAYVLEDSYNQLRMRPSLDLKGRLTVQFQGEEGIDAGGLTREWYQLLSRVIFDKGALLFTTVGNNATFQPNPNSVYQTEHLSYFKFVGRVVAKAVFDGQLLDVYFTRSFYKHILGIKVTYHDIEAVDPDYYKNLKWMLENDVSDIPDLTFSMDADEEKHILYEKNEVMDYELKPGGRNIRVTEETKHEYVDLVAEHILTNAIRPQINSFLEGFNELVPRDLISIFNDKELELLISGLPEIDLDDLKANTEYTGYSAASSVVQWFWEVVKAFSKEDMAKLLQFVTGTSKVPLEGFRALQGISGPQRFQIHKAYGAPKRLPSAHTCFNQLDVPEYSSKEQLQERLLLAIHEASEGFGFG
ncbi:E3 ubiquitin-protein ligase UPL1-like isoform X2 [Aristolochia californica]|uniref:E3 ubiquitin-protein ligase UPL1-like isoform X2 n=1 Tax=Aristolochia californica TaxID=171875 RepID=UPI0035D93243